jgi:hypothetical protein
MFAASNLARTVLPRRTMTSAYAAVAGGQYSSSATGGSLRTVTALGRWSIANKQLPAVDKIKALHVYDFDNTRELISLRRSSFGGFA